MERYPPPAGMSGPAPNVIVTYLFADRPSKEQTDPIAVSAADTDAKVPKSPPEALYTLPSYLSAVTVFEEFSHTLMDMPESGIATVSQFVILTVHMMPLLAHEPLPEVFMTSRLSLFVGGGMGVIVKVGVTVAVKVRVIERFGVGVRVGVAGFATYFTAAIAPTRHAL